MQPTLAQHIEMRRGRRGELRAYVAGSRVRVQDIVSDHERHGMTPDEIVREHPHLSLAQVHAALAYYFDHRDEIRSQMKADAELAEQMQRQAGQPAEGEGRADAAGDSVSS